MDEQAKKAEQSRIGKSNVRRSKAHERRVAHLLTEWAGTEFRRRRNEGRDFQTVAVESTADVIPVTSDFRFSVEAKCGTGFSLDALMAAPAKSLFSEWWHQCCFDATLLSEIKKRNYLPLLFFKPHPNHDWIAISERAVDLLHPRFEDLDGPGVSPTSAYIRQAANGGQARLWFPHLVFDAYNWIGPVQGNVSHSKRHKKLVDLELHPVILCRWHDFAATVRPDPLFFNLVPLQPKVEGAEGADNGVRAV